jgi:hypothetical protein
MQVPAALGIAFKHTHNMVTNVPLDFCPRPLPFHLLLLQDDDIPGVVRYRTYEVLKAEAANPRLRWAYLPYSMHMAGPREAIQHMIIRKNYGEQAQAHPRQGCKACAMPEAVQQGRDSGGMS